MADGCPRCKNALPEPPAGGGPVSFCPACGLRLDAPLADLPGTDVLHDVGDSTLPESGSDEPDSLGHHGRFRPGDRLGKRYRVVALLGRGGMGEVYRADDLELGVTVALKLLPPDLAQNPRALERLRSEVRTARQVAHPNVCRIYDLGQAGGHVFLTMEYVDGEDLVATLRRLGRPTPEKALQIAKQLCAGLAATHDQGVLHGDLKPANIMIDGRGRLRIADFGLARRTEGEEPEGTLIGTPNYMAPEQLEGHSAEVRSDIFSLGLVLYELFTGRRPYEATEVTDLRAQHSSGDIPSPGILVTDMDPAVERVILQCLERDPADRPPSVYSVMAALPGGDPIAAALAAGETPSPELVASTGATVGMRPSRALALVGITAILLIAHGLLRSGQIRWPATPPQELNFLAEQIARKVGYEETPEFQYESYEYFYRQLGPIARASKAPDRWDGLNEDYAGWYYGIHWSKLPIRPTSISTPIVTFNDSQPHTTGAISMALDDRGRLLGFSVLLPTDDEGVPEPSPLESGLVPELAGFDLSDLEEISLKDALPVPHDEARAWRVAAFKGEDDEDELILKAGSYRNKLVYLGIFRGGRPKVLAHLLDWRRGGGNPLSPFILYILALSFLNLLTLLVACWNIANGRADRRGALRFGIFVSCCVFLASFLGTAPGKWGHWRTLEDMTSEYFMAHTLYSGFFACVAYLAIEPFARKLWPRSLVSWMRLVRGRVRDPLVGRDLLFGALAASVSVLGLSLLVALLRVMGQPIPPPVPEGPTMWALRGARGGFWLLFWLPWYVSTLSLGMVFRLVLAKYVLRVTWVAAIAAACLPGDLMYLWFLFFLPFPALVAACLWIGLIGYAVFVRYGLVAMVSYNFVFTLSWVFLSSLDLTSWHGYLIYICTGTFALGAMFAVRAATAGRTWFPQEAG